MDGDGKKPLKTAVIEFYKLNSNKGKDYTVKYFKKGAVHIATKSKRSKRKSIKKLSLRCLTIWKDEFMWQIKMDFKAFWNSEALN